MGKAMFSLSGDVKIDFYSSKALSEVSSDVPWLHIQSNKH